ncbi:ABC transporter ATP-binding protein [Actinotalea sp. BY-33]|uniref:ABC transporter ATP-binding protein n=1 Tax=Actinotalea soli TaxID=2819234 RepID=A0A939RUX9_9CELL|nr:ABC transporter ATP-binding protein [Actinotalea soli]MBO1751825.1 ABC transporter ATP-binding protein [Actinotalea soli]
MTPPAVRSAGLTKRFRSGQVAVDGIELEVPRGSVYGFLGPNGSGKTTTIRMLLGLVRPTAGRAWLLEEPMPEGGGSVLPRVGVLVEGPAFHPYLTGRANLARLDAADATADPRTTRRRSDAALERVGLAAAAAKPFRQYSLGMKQRLGLAAALLRPRDLLVLDEPTNGLDPQGTREVRHLIRELADAGTTVLVSSHLLAEIDQVCSHIGIMSQGKLLVQDERLALTERGEPTLVVRTAVDHVGTATEVLTALGLGAPVVDGPEVTASLGSVAPETATAALVGAGVPVVGLEARRPSLEQLFVTLTGEGFDVAR